MRDELQGTGVTLTTIMPGVVRTRLADGIPLQGLLAVEPDAVAREVIHSWRRPEDEIAVPRWLSGYTPVAWLAGPERMRKVLALIGADRVLTRVDTAARRAYEEAVVAQVAIQEAS